ncbi:MAG: NADH-quinone oxidoreductase subunit C [Bryobacterales bacterium]|nr:NADH-quinone oxidoreductase subunit C [Bryobacterales bacterium]
MISDAAASYPIVSALEKAGSALLINASVALGELTLEVPAESILTVCKLLRDEQAFNRLSTVTAVDRYPTEPRFEVVYHLYSIRDKQRVRVKARVGTANLEIDSVIPVWPSANWYEREVFDLFGIRFRNHPELTRIMMPDNWEGHPLRRDYPTHGHRYDYATPEGGIAR